MKKNSKIKSIRAREILDSRGNPTLEVEVESDFGIFKSSVPSGASKGKYEAIELRDGGKRFGGKGVLKAVKNINQIIAPKLEGREVLDQKGIDEFLIKLDGTKDKSHLGANAILAVSLAICRAGAGAKNLPLYQYISELSNNEGPLKLPLACFNIINGGIHAGNDLDFQEFMIVPQEKSFSRNLQIAAEIYHELRKKIKEKYGQSATNIGDEGGFAPPLKKPEEAIELILKAGKELGYLKKIELILDIAANQFFKEEIYETNFGKFKRKNLTDYYLSLIKKYPLLGLEDPFSEDDWLGWQMLKSQTKILIIGDDLLATNPQRIKMAKEKDACNGAIIKINQIGTVTEAIKSARLAQSLGWKIVVSHRSGETTDDFIADFAIGIGADFIKAGAPARGERVAKYNRLLKIEDELMKIEKRK